MIIDRNSLIAFYLGNFSGRFSIARFSVYEYIVNNPNSTRQDLDEDHDFPYRINSICARVNELVKAGMLIEIKEYPRNRFIAVLPPKEDEAVTIKGVQMPKGISK